MSDNRSKVDFRCFLRPKIAYAYTEDGSLYDVQVGVAGGFACHNFLHLSIQASENSYCTPRRNLRGYEDPTLYTHFEIALFYNGEFYNPAKEHPLVDPGLLPEEVRSWWRPHDDVVGWVSQEKVQEIFDILVIKEEIEPQDFSWDMVTTAKTKAEVLLGWSINK